MGWGALAKNVPVDIPPEGLEIGIEVCNGLIDESWRELLAWAAATPQTEDRDGHPFVAWLSSRVHSLFGTVRAMERQRITYLLLQEERGEHTDATSMGVYCSHVAVSHLDSEADLSRRLMDSLERKLIAFACGTPPVSVDCGEGDTMQYPEWIAAEFDLLRREFEENAWELTRYELALRRMADCPADVEDT